MSQTDISSAVASNLTTQISDYSVSSMSTDAGEGEIRYQITNWNQNLGYYKKIPELRAVIDAKATWTVGKGFESDAETEAILGFIKGFGNDTFNTILENMIRTMQIAGDSFAEIIRDDETGEIINIKTLDPSTMVIIADKKGFIKRYEQTSKTNSKTKPLVFEKEEIWHLSRNRVADEIHGVSLIESLEDIILMRNQAMDDWKRVMHRNIEPLWIIHLDTDDTTKITAFKDKMDAARGKGENMYVPKDVVVPEMVTTAPNASLNPLPWITQLNSYFYQSAGVPQIILGSSQEFTEATAKIAYLAFQQTIEEDQMYIEQQVEEQLGYIIELEFPVSLENEMLTDRKKDGDFSESPMQFKASETTAGEENKE